MKVIKLKFKIKDSIVGIRNLFQVDLTCEYYYIKEMKIETSYSYNIIQHFQSLFSSSLVMLDKAPTSSNIKSNIWLLM